MATELNKNQDLLIPDLIGKPKGKFYIVTADWNKEITHALRDGAEDTLRKAGLKESDIIKVSVPGTVELINAAGLISQRGEASAIIILGCVIRGDTPHFDYVCQIAASGTALLNSSGKTPVIFGVLTVETLDQAQQRAGGELGNKGAEAAATAIEMVNLHLSFNI